MYKIAIMVYPDAEELDFVGPYETLASQDGSVDVKLVSESLEPVKAFNGLRVLPDMTFFDKERYDVLMVPGGEGRRNAMYHGDVLEFIKKQTEGLTHLCSICTGAFILAEAGLLDGLKPTTHHSAMRELKRSYAALEVVEKRVVKNDTKPKIWCAGGISSGIDLSLELLAELLGEDAAKETADRMEYMGWDRSRCASFLVDPDEQQRKTEGS